MRLLALLAAGLLALVVGSAAIAGADPSVARYAKNPQKCKNRRTKRCHHKKGPSQPVKLPAKFFGVNPNFGIPSEQDFARMKAGGVATYRTPLYWSNVEYERGTYNWDRSQIDEAISRAAKAGVDVMPFIWGTPLWMKGSEQNLPVDTPEERQAWADFLKAVVGRYGPGGSFWDEHAPGTADPVPARAIRAWQIWNEANYHYFAFPASPERYGELLKVAGAAIRQADPGAKIVTGGIFGKPSSRYPKGMYATAFLKRLYKVPGIKQSFDAVALHPYASEAVLMKPQITAIRSIMDGAGDNRAQIWLTEFGWGSGKTSPENSFLKGLMGQKAELIAAYKMLATNQRKWKIGRTYYFSWGDSPALNTCSLCYTSGLFTVSDKAKPSWYGLVKLTGGSP